MTTIPFISPIWIFEEEVFEEDKFLRPSLDRYRKLPSDYILKWYCDKYDTEDNVPIIFRGSINACKLLKRNVYPDIFYDERPLYISYYKNFLGKEFLNYDGYFLPLFEITDRAYMQFIKPNPPTKKFTGQVLDNVQEFIKSHPSIFLSPLRPSMEPSELVFVARSKTNIFAEYRTLVVDKKVIYTYPYFEESGCGFDVFDVAGEHTEYIQYIVEEKLADFDLDIYTLDTCLLEGHSVMPNMKVVELNSFSAAALYGLEYNYAKVIKAVEDYAIKKFYSSYLDI